MGDCGGGLVGSGSAGPLKGGGALLLDQDMALPALRKEKVEEDLGTGISLRRPLRNLPSSWTGRSVDDGAVEAPLNLDELSAVEAMVDAVLV